jgi:hypothetical protein
MSNEIAQAHLIGEIANDMKLTPGGLLTMNILVHYEGPRGPIPNYIPVKAFRPESETILGLYSKGQRVDVLADIKMNKPKGAEYYQINLIIDTIKEVGVVGDLKQAFDATEAFETDGIPF